MVCVNFGDPAIDPLFSRPNRPATALGSTLESRHRPHPRRAYLVDSAIAAGQSSSSCLYRSGLTDMRILFVDDHRLVRQALSHYLKFYDRAIDVIEATACREQAATPRWSPSGSFFRIHLLSCFPVSSLGRKRELRLSAVLQA